MGRAGSYSQSAPPPLPGGAWQGGGGEDVSVPFPPAQGRCGPGVGTPRTQDSDAEAGAGSLTG